ncbi:hypothetical protein CTEN210_11730 [Chaetoceros tenuissimus]|uniref:Hexosyltransferase n=1 Tax=Chaetoceros tenuissimus TaxID=426638 RepID=A0AAD3D090_9STRA|nr:hypothetical protein CTEN210_11730 [Chaetoceros tenuissimus]
MGRQIAFDRLRNTVGSHFYNNLAISNVVRAGSKRNTQAILTISLLAVACLLNTIGSTSSSRGSSFTTKPIGYNPISDRALKEMNDLKKEYSHERPLSSKTTMLLGIFSTNASDKYIHRRTYIRDTWLNTADPRICKLSEYIRQLEADNDSVCQVPYTFIIAAGGKHRPFDHDDKEPLSIIPKESERVNDEDDCTYLNVRESMEDGKSATYFKFGAELAQKYNIDYITKLDDDTIPSPTLLMDFIKDELPPYPFNRRIFGGRSWAFPEVYYGAGQFYFMSSDLADHVGNKLTAKDRHLMALSFKNRKIEDTDMGFFLFSSDRPLKFVDLTLHRFWEHGLKDEEGFRETWEEIAAENSQRLPRSEAFPFWHFCPHFLG